MMTWLTNTEAGRLVFTGLVSMLPVAELRVGIPFGVALGLGHWDAFLAAVLGNLIPAPFIILFARRILQWLRRFPRLDGLVSRIERKAHLKGRRVRKYRWFGLCLFVAVPLPGTGAWTGALIAAFLDMRIKSAFPSIVLGFSSRAFLFWASRTASPPCKRRFRSSA
jgi:uncharacterized membrane protein